jgi:hypothetical protein
LLLFEDLRCVSCGSGRVRRCRRRGLVEHTFLRFLRLHPFHCIDCYRRFYNRSEPSNVQPGNLPVMAESPKVPQGQPSLKIRPIQEQPSLEKKPLQDQSGLKTKALQDQPSVKTKVPVNGSRVEKRGFSRLNCRIPARVVFGSGYSTTGVVSGISLNGCFVETPTTFPVGSEIELTLASGQETHTRALVRRSVPATGMGLEFTLTNVPNFRRLQTIARNSVRLQVNLLTTSFR